MTMAVLCTAHRVMFPNSKEGLVGNYADLLRAEWSARRGAKTSEKRVAILLKDSFVFDVLRTSCMQ